MDFGLPRPMTGLAASKIHGVELVIVLLDQAFTAAPHDGSHFQILISLACEEGMTLFFLPMIRQCFPMKIAP